MIIQLDEAKRTLLQKAEDIEELKAALKLDDLKAETEMLEKKTLEPDFWGSEDSGAILKRVKYLGGRVGYRGGSYCGCRERGGGAEAENRDPSFR